MKKLTLQEPIKRGDETVTEVTLTKPRAGAMRGLAITDLMQMDVTAVSTLLMRITTPALTPSEIADLSAPDLIAFSQEIIGFFMTRAEAVDAGLI